MDTCIGRLEQIIRGETKLVLDADWIILGEYSRNLHPEGSPMLVIDFSNGPRNQLGKPGAVRIGFDYAY